MKTLGMLFVLALALTFACGQLPSPRDAPQVAPPERGGGGLAPVTPGISQEAPSVTAMAVGAETVVARATAEAGGKGAEASAGPSSTPQPAPFATASPAAPALGATPAAAATPAGGPAPQGAIPRGDRGALVRVTVPGEVGVLLDEYPPEMRDRVAQALLAQPEEEWLARAQRQVRLTHLRLNFRDSNEPGKGQLPLTQPELWSFALDEAGPERRSLQGHELITLRYTMTTTLLSDPDSVAAAEPALADVGGAWEEYFLLPVDPDLLLQRTGRACLNDDGFPPNSIDSENTANFYDFDRTNCFETLVARVGAVETRLRFQRIAWDAALADRVRLSPPQTGQGADLRVVGSDLERNRIIYRYVTESDCALQEGAVGGSGWRRLLQFEATVQNVGDAPLFVGPAVAGGEGSVFEYAPCHDHVHYRHYGVFTLDDGIGLQSSKQAFCVQSTDRVGNHELSPLTHDYSCRFQGIQTGWVDEYIAGLDTQWVDITNVDVGPEGRTVTLGFISNPDGFLCEGTPRLDADGQQLWEPSGLGTEEGEPILRPQCDFARGWDENNVATREVFVPPVGSFVTAPCRNGESGPLRNCGFQELTLDGVDATCRVAQPVNLSLHLTEEGAPLVVRACERSAVLGTGVACAYQDARANVVVGEGGGALSFSCPAVRDGEATDGNYALYVAPLWPGDEMMGVEVAN